MGGVGSEVVGVIRTGLEAEPAEIIEIRLCDGLEGLHEVLMRGLFWRELLRG